MNPTDLDLIRALCDPERATLTLMEAERERSRRPDEAPTRPQGTLLPTESALPERRYGGRASLFLLLGA